MVPLFEIVSEAESVCRIKSEERNIQFRHDFPEDFQIYCHKNLAEQALINYLDNAIKSGPENSQVIIRAEREGNNPFYLF